MFGGAYTGVIGRPIYGALNLAGHPDGAAPRFGSCHLVLAAGVPARSTFCHGDSHLGPAAVGTADAFGAIRAALIDEVARTGQALGVPAPTVGSPPGWETVLAARRAALQHSLDDPSRHPLRGHAPGRTLDDYVEAQIHGGLTLSDDVTAIVADPSFQGTPTEAHLASLGIPLHWHAGFTLAAADVPADLRGPEVPPLARRIATRHRRPDLDAELIGRAARAAATDPHRLQLIKYLWHLLVLLGRPAHQSRH